MERRIETTKRGDERLFTLKECEGEFFTGKCRDGRQVVMGLLCPNLVACFFDSAGNFLEIEFQPWKKPAERMAPNGPFKIYDEEFRAAIDVQRHAWQSSIGFEPRAIHIRQFWDPQNYIGIELMPEHLRDFETAKETTDEDREYLAADRDQWITEGKYVWWWGKDYWIDKNGEVEST